jgi:hypothetical protein
MQGPCKVQYAKDISGVRVEAAPKLVGFCPTCGVRVQSKCGTLVAWHFAHLACDNCDPWKEGETAWHRGWKALFPEECREVVKDNHRADVLVGDTAVEFQHSPIPTQDRIARDEFWGRIIWVVSVPPEQLDLRPGRGRPASDRYRSFRWKWPRKSFFNSKAEIWLDVAAHTEVCQYTFKATAVPRTLLQVRKLYAEVPCGGWGFLRDPSDLINQVNRGPLWAYAKKAV